MVGRVWRGFTLAVLDSPTLIAGPAPPLPVPVGAFLVASQPGVARAVDVCVKDGEKIDTDSDTPYTHGMCHAVIPPGGVHLGILRTPSPGVGLLPGRVGLPVASRLTETGDIGTGVAGSLTEGVGAFCVFLARPGRRENQHSWNFIFLCDDVITVL